MIETRFRLVDLADRWGRVTVRSASGEQVRQYRISGAELAMIKAGVLRTCPGCTDAEWTSGRAVIGGQACEDGQAILHEDGTLVACYGIDESGGQVNVKLLAVPPSEYQLQGDVIHMLPHVAAMTEA